ncbi:MAG: Lrp/AsnC family transcriptional regulator [Chitinophagaceae bacterium]|nr:Lrp/AsnC family transcriptional regulator [Chitinophagaceae bacterium]
MPLSPKTENSTNPVQLDAKDLAILRLLQHNARITVKEISEQIHLSTTPVHERIKRLEESGIIRQYVTLLDAEKVRKGLKVICYVSLKQHSKEAGSKFIRRILDMPEVVECYNISGEFDFMLKIVAENMNSYYDFHVNRLGEVENIGNIQSVFVMGVIKETTALL